MSSRKRNKAALNPEALGRTLDRLLAPARADAILLAYSGGADSTVLLHLLTRLRNHRDFSLHAVHFDHGLSSASDSWVQHCSRMCAQLGVPLHTESLDVCDEGKGMEAAARAARYAALERELASGEVLLTAHHRDDQAETLLLRLARGAGTRGLAGLLPVRRFAAGQLARPLLEYSREEILDYARTHGLEWVEDESNEDRSFDRNYLRHEILPALRGRWPGIDRVLARTAGLLADERVLLEERAREDWDHCAVGDELSVSACTGLSDARLRNLLVHWLSSMPPAMRHIDELVGQIREPSATRHAAIGWSGGEVRRYRDRLLLHRSLSQVESFSYSWDPDEELEIPGLGIVLRSQRVQGRGLALARLRAPLTVRGRVGGERYRLPGQAFSRPLKKLLQESGIPPWQRPRLPLLFVGEDLAAIGDRWVCAPFAAGPHESGLTLHIEAISP